MPELPEVETLCRQLQEKIAGKQIRSAHVHDQKLAGLPNLKRRIVRRVRRIGKSITLELDNGQCVSIHLRMSGRLFWHQDEQILPHTRWRISFTDEQVDLVDPRRFATIKVLPRMEGEPDNDLVRTFDETNFFEGHAKRRVPVKGLLMDPKAFAGIGNIYACEILHRVGVGPERQACTLSVKDWKAIFRQGRHILEKGIEKRGTSISDWRDLHGQTGENQMELKAYGREGETCTRCGGQIKRIKQGGRSTYYCPGCQK